MFGRSRGPWITDFDLFKAIEKEIVCLEVDLYLSVEPNGFSLKMTLIWAKKIRMGCLMIYQVGLQAGQQ